MAATETIHRVPIYEFGAETNACATLYRSGKNPHIWCFVGGCGVQHPDTCDVRGEMVATNPSNGLVLYVCELADNSICSLKTSSPEPLA